MPETSDTLRSLVIPLQGDALLVPSAVVAEVFSYNPPEPVEGGEDWYLGVTRWREHDIPVVSMEVALDMVAPEYHGTRARVIVMYTLGGHAEMPFYGIVAQEIPQVFRAGRDNVRALDEDSEGQPFISSRVELKDIGRAMIPNLDELQKKLLGLFGSH